MMSSLPDNRLSIDAAWKEADILINLLRQWGIDYLVGEDHAVPPEKKATDLQVMAVLVKRLAQCEYPRVRDASISLYILHPEFAPAVLQALLTSEPEIAEQIATLVLATFYLQRFWYVRLALASGRLPSFPESPFAFLWQKRHLPPPSESHDGKWGLAALQAAEQSCCGTSLNVVEDWQNQIRHLLLQEEAQRQHFPTPSMKIALPSEPAGQEIQERDTMSMRPNVDRYAIEQFLKDIGRVYRKVGRLYITGGASLVHAGLRPGSTQDIDIETTDGDLIAAIRQVGQRRNINVEFASPKDFIPLPRQWETLSRYVGRYGNIDVFYFDFYSLALSKIDRGSTRDIRDVKLLLQQHVITFPELDAAFQEVVTQMGKGSYVKLDPLAFTQRYESVRPQLNLP